MNTNIVQLAHDFVESKNKGHVRKVTPYNVFSAWKMSENDHTKLLLSLLRYKDSSGHYSVLRSFLRRFAKPRVYYNGLREPKIQFNPCYPGDDKRSLIDGLIVDRNKKFAIIIENKIFDAADQKDQIRRYITRMEEDENINIENIWVFYITGDGTKEVDQKSYNYEEENDATNIGRRFVPLSYSRDIIDWLKEDVLEARIYPESLTSVVRTYVEFLEKELFSSDDNQNWMPDLRLISKQGRLSVCNPLTKVDDIIQLYSLYNEVAACRQALGKDERANDQDITDVELLYKSIRLACTKVEEAAFQQFEKVSIDILNEQWRRELKKKQLTWKAKHRGVRGENGFVQISLTDDWGTAHLEWTSINPQGMFGETDYVLELHVEGNKSLANQWKQSLEADRILLPSNGKIYQTSRIFKCKVTTDKPIAKMKEKELTSLLRKVYTQDMNFLCRQLVEKYSDYSK